MFFCGLARVCFLSRFTRSTIAVPLDGFTRSTFACLPRSLPERTRTVSPFFTCGFCGGSSFCFLAPAYISNDLGSERNDLHELPLAQLAGHRSEDARAHRLVLIVDQHRSVVIELDVGAIATAKLLHGADDDCFDHGALLDRSIGRGFFDRGGDDVADAGVFAGRRAADHLDRRNLLRAGVVRDVQDCSHLNHCRISHSVPGCRLPVARLATGNRELATSSSPSPLPRARSSASASTADAFPRSPRDRRR